MPGLKIKISLRTPGQLDAVTSALEMWVDSLTTSATDKAAGKAERASDNRALADAKQALEIIRGNSR